MLLLILVEPSDTLDRHIIRFGRTRGEYNVLWVSADKVSNMLEELC